jgi:hypothetical protein
MKEWGNTRLTPAPCFRLATFDYPVHRYYRQLRENEDASPPTREATHLAITRQDYTVRPLELERIERDLLSRLVDGSCLADAIEQAAAAAASIDEFAAKLPHWFQRWMTERLFIAIELS